MSETSRTLSFRVDAEGRLVAEPVDARRIGLRPGDILRIETGDPLWVARRPVTDLARVYVEPTNACNLACATCVRNVWSAQSGFMEQETFDAILQGPSAIPRPPAVFFGGFGEPLAHPRILSMVEGARRLGSRVEMITNGILLDEEVRRALISLGLHRLWVSLDGATPSAYRDVRSETPSRRSSRTSPPSAGSETPRPASAPASDRLRRDAAEHRAASRRREAGA